MQRERKAEGERSCLFCCLSRGFFCLFCFLLLFLSLAACGFPLSPLSCFFPFYYFSFKIADKSHYLQAESQESAANWVAALQYYAWNILCMSLSEWVSLCVCVCVCDCCLHEGQTTGLSTHTNYNALVFFLILVLVWYFLSSSSSSSSSYSWGFAFVIKVFSLSFSVHVLSIYLPRSLSKHNYIVFGVSILSLYMRKNSPKNILLHIYTHTVSFPLYS